VSQIEAEKAYQQVVPFGIRLCRDWFGLRALEFMPRSDSPLNVTAAGQEVGTSVKLVADYLMCPIVLGRHRWQIEELEFAKRVCTGGEPVTLVDIGANMGLFSRQMLAVLPAIAESFLYEPEAQNFASLLHNLKPFGDKVTAFEAALSNEAASREFYLDPTNNGNFSLNVDAMPPNHYKTTITTKDVAAEYGAWMASGRRIFYKSDTEGFDEFIAASIPAAFWPQVFAGIMELWRIKKPAFDIERFAAVLDHFPNKIFLANADMRVAEAPVTTSDILDYVKGSDRLHRDLGFWR
jgi:FkbM family methyltransferase